MAEIRCDNIMGGCPHADGSVHEADSLQEFCEQHCPILANGKSCEAYEVGSQDDPATKGGEGGGFVKKVMAGPLPLIAAGVFALGLLGAGGLWAWNNLIGPSCDVEIAQNLMALEPSVGEMEELGADCLDAGLAAADMDMMVIGTALLRGASDGQSPMASYRLGTLFDPLKREELEAEAQVPSLLPANDAREALRFYDRAGPENAEAVAAAAALRERYPELALNAVGQEGAPLEVTGHEGLARRILTKPGAMLYPQADDSSAGQPTDVFDILYVFETSPGWLRVGESYGAEPAGWLKESDAQEWNVMLVMQYTPPDNRKPVLFFRDQIAAKSVATQPGVSGVVDELIASSQSSAPDPRLVAVEENTVDWSASPYLMPILKTERVSSDDGRNLYLAEVGSVSGLTITQNRGGPIAPGRGGYCDRINPADAVHQIVFVIDTTISMGPYINGVRQIAGRWESEIRSRGLTDKFRFGVVAYRNNMDEEPQASGLEYVTRNALTLSPSADVGAFVSAVNELSPSSVSTHSFNEDAVAGLDEALRMGWQQGCGLKLVFLVTDAGSLNSDDPKARLRGTGLSTIAASAQSQEISVFPVHIHTPEARGANNIETASQQYRGDLSDGRGTPLYKSVRDGSAAGFQSYLNEVGILIDAIENEVNDQLVTREELARPSGEAPTVEQLVLGKLFAVQQRFLGTAANAQAPAFTSSWTSDRDLSNPDVAALDVSILLNRRQLGQLAEKIQRLVNNAEAAQTESGEFFELLRVVSAATSQDPTRFSDAGSQNLSALMPSFLSLLPYKSEVLSLTGDDWRTMGANRQDAFVRGLKEKLSFYRRIEADQSKWSNISGNNPDEQVAQIPLRVMP